MPLRTFTSAGVNNLWSNPANWDVLPVNNDSAIIPAGQVCDFDVDQSAWANGLVGLTINGELRAYTVAGSYYLKMVGNISATVAGGILRAGTLAVPYPSNCLFTIYLNSYQINCNAGNFLTLQLHCYEPSAQFIQLISATARAITSVTVGATTTIGCVGHGYAIGNTIYLANVGGFTRAQLNNRFFEVASVPTLDSFTIRYPDPDIAVNSTGWGPWTGGGLVCPGTAEAIGQVQLEVDTDVSADPEWLRAGALVRIDNINRAQQSEERTLVGVAAGFLTIGAGLTATKLSGSLAVLVTRNVRINTSAVALGTGMIRYGTGHYLNAEIRPGSLSSIGVYQVNDSIFSKGAISYCNYAFASSTNVVINGGVISGCAYGVYTCTPGLVINGGLISGCSSSGVYDSVDTIINGGTISGCYLATWGCTGIIINDGVFYGNNTGIYLSYNVTVNGGTIASNTYAMQNGSGVTLNGGAMPGNYYGLYACNGVVINNTIIAGSYGGIHDCTATVIKGGLISKCSTGIDQCSASVFSGGIISGCPIGIINGEGSFRYPGITLALNTCDMCSCSLHVGYAASLNSVIQVFNFVNNNAGRNDGRAQIVIRDIGGVPGALKAWMYAGRIIDRSGIEPNFTIGTTRKYIFENSTTPVFLDRVVFLENGRKIGVYASLQKDANGMTETPRIQIFDEGYDPFDGYAVGAEQVMADNLLQQDYILSYTALRTGNHVVRVRGKNAAGNLYAGMKIYGGITVIED